MIRADRELLARLARLNHALGDVVVEWLNHLDGIELPAAGLRMLAGDFDAMAAQLRARADHIDQVIDAPDTTRGDQP